MAYNANHKIRIKDLKPLAEETKEELVTLNDRTSCLTIDYGGIKNNIFRGQDLGAFTSAHLAAIKAGTFDDMYIGDFFTHDGKMDVIAGFNYSINGASAAYNIILWRITHYQDSSKFFCAYNRWPSGTEGEEDYDPGTYNKCYVESNWYTVIRPYFIEEIEAIYGAANIPSMTIVVPTSTSGYTVTGWAEASSKAHLPTLSMWGSQDKYLNLNNWKNSGYIAPELPLHRLVAKAVQRFTRNHGTVWKSTMWGATFAEYFQGMTYGNVIMQAGQTRNILGLHPSAGQTDPTVRWMYDAETGDSTAWSGADDCQKICPVFMVG